MPRLYEVLKYILFACLLHYKGTAGQDACFSPRITYTNHSTPYIYQNSTVAHLICTLASSSSLAWWRSRDPCGPFNVSSTCTMGSRTCMFNIVENQDYLYHCCTASAAVSPGSTAASDQVYCLQVNLCPSRMAVRVFAPPVAFFGETLVLYLALEASPSVGLSSTLSLFSHTNTTSGRVVPSNLPRPSVLYEFVIHVPQLDVGGVEDHVHIGGKTPCPANEINHFEPIFFTDRMPVNHPPLSSPALTMDATEATTNFFSSSASLTPVSTMTTAGGDFQPTCAAKGEWILPVLVCVIVLLLILLLGTILVFSCYVHKLRTAKVSPPLEAMNGNSHHYNPLSAASHDDSTPSDTHPLQFRPAEQDRMDVSPPAYHDITPRKSRSNCFGILPTPSPSLTDQRLPGVNSPTQTAASECSTGVRQPPQSLPIQLTHEVSPLMGMDTPLKVGGAQALFSQQSGGNTPTAVKSPVEMHIYAKPAAPLPPIPSSGPRNGRSSVTDVAESNGNIGGSSSVHGWREASPIGEACNDPQSSSVDEASRVFSNVNTLPPVGGDGSSGEDTSTYSTKVIQGDANQVTLPGNGVLNSDSRNV